MHRFYRGTNLYIGQVLEDAKVIMVVSRGVIMKKLFPFFAAAALTACTHPPKYQIATSTPAYIEVDGIIICEKTPCIITPPYYGGGGICDDIHSKRSILAAFPLDKSKGFVQHKEISARCGETKNVYFDMEATSGVQTVPRARVE